MGLLGGHAHLRTAVVAAKDNDIVSGHIIVRILDGSGDTDAMAGINISTLSSVYFDIDDVPQAIGLDPSATGSGYDVPVEA